MYTSLYDERINGDLIAPERVRTSHLAGIPGANRFFRLLAPLYPGAFERFDFSPYDTIISSTTAWAKGIKVPPHAVHVCYINTVSRFLFAYDQYVGGFGLRTLAKPVIQRLAKWDRQAAQRPTAFIANSQNVADRVRTYYGRDAYVLHCPVDIDRFTLGRGNGDYFFVASRLLPYKRIDLAIDAAQAAGVKLLVAGIGPAEKALRERARGSTTTMLGFISDEQLRQHLGEAIAVILPGEEDFGLVPLEAAACGTPTIAYRAGGARETVVEGKTGMFFQRQDPNELAALLRTFDRRSFDANFLREHAQTFAPDNFVARLKSIVSDVQTAHGH